MRVQQYDVVGKIVRDQQAIAARSSENGKSSGIGDGGTSGSLTYAERNLLPRCEALRRNLDETLRRYLAFGEFVNGNSITGTGRLFSCGVGDGTHRRVNVF